MNTKQHEQSGSITVDLLGSIRNHIDGLQGYYRMALELIQNADDARADNIVFDIRDDGLRVTNNAEFKYCRKLESRPCEFQKSKGRECDYHRIVNIASGGKLSQGENIGRFGIGFVSTYQVTDQPEICSAGIKLTLRPEEGRWIIESYNEDGTSFFLPWARKPSTKARDELDVSHITNPLIETLVEDFQRVLRESLLFLLHVKKAEVRRNGKLLLSCELERHEDSELIVSLRPSGEVEQWYILRVDAEDAASALCENHHRLKSSQRSTKKRNTKISIGIRIDPEPLANGFLYAYLPTEQKTGLPLHINADFFPEPDRKAVIFAGQHKGAWNEMLIEECAKELAREPEQLLERLGEDQFWRILESMYNLSKSSNHPDCFKHFWKRIKSTAANARIVTTRGGTKECPKDVFFPGTKNDSLDADHVVEALKEVGGHVVVKELREFKPVIGDLGGYPGARDLDLAQLVCLLKPELPKEPTKVETHRLETFYKPIWKLISDLLWSECRHVNIKGGGVDRVKDLKELPVFLTEDLRTVTANESYMVPKSLKPRKVATLLPGLAIAYSDIFNISHESQIEQLFLPFDFSDVALKICTKCKTEPIEKVISVKKEDLRDLYTLFADLDKQSTDYYRKNVYSQLRKIPMWLSSGRLIDAEEVLLPDDFTDPTGETKLLERCVFTKRARQFVLDKLEVKRQTIEVYVENVLLPGFFNKDGPRNEDGGPLNGDKYALLVEELAEHAKNDAICDKIRALPIAPTKDGRWASPTNVYRHTPELTKILGDAKHLWLDVSRMPNTLKVKAFFDNLGILQSPIARHLVDRMIDISKTRSPTEKAIHDSSEAFYVLCDKYEEWKDEEKFKEAIADLGQANCFPASGDSDSWHSPNSLHAPYKAEAFQSQAKILYFCNTKRLEPALLEELGFIKPETQLVIDHLLHCVNSGISPHISTYQVLNERAEEDDSRVSTLAKSPCIYVERENKFVRPNQLYWTPQSLGRYAFTIPKKLESFRPLFDKIGVKTSPEAQDLIEILLDIIGEYHEKSIALNDKDKAIYENCFERVALAYGQDELNGSDLVRLQEAPSILNLKGDLTHPDKLLLQDSEWYASFFNGKLDQALTKPKPELWSLFEEIGVKKLSDSAQVTLKCTDGDKSDETSFIECVIERTDILERLLWDKPKVREKVKKAISKLKAVSYHGVSIQALVNVGGDEVRAPPVPDEAFYEIENNRLVLSRPVNDRSWAHIFDALFHQLMPEESGSEILKLTLSVRSLMQRSVKDAHLVLTNAGIPDIDGSKEITNRGELASANLDDMGAVTETTSNTENEKLSTSDNGPTIEFSDTEPINGSTDDDTPVISDNKSTNETSGKSESSHQGEEVIGKGDYSTSRDYSNKKGTGQQRIDKSRPEHNPDVEEKVRQAARKYEIGLAGEEMIMELERKKLCDAGEPRLAEKIIHVSKERGDDKGYDISSYDVDGTEILIEVKTTEKDEKTGFIITANERHCARQYKEKYKIYRIFEFNPDSRTGEVSVLSVEQLEKMRLTPSQFKCEF